jgi:cell division protease FtsH
MSLAVPESQLPQELTIDQAVDAAYAADLAAVASDLRRGLPVLIECDKDLVPWAFMNVRNRLRQEDLRCIFLDGRAPDDGGGAGGMPQTIIGTMLAQLRDAVRGAVEQRVVVLPHLDLLTTSQGGLTGEAREVITLLYENPELVWLGFKDPSFPLPRVIENLFPHRYPLLGVPRERLPQLITQSESRKFGRSFNPWALYKYVSGMNPARLRKLLSTLEGEDYPDDPARAYQQIRKATSGGKLEVPSIDLETEIGGYEKVKRRLRTEILDILERKDACGDPAQIVRLEKLIPRGMIFWGPPGTGKTLFAKAMATAIGAAIQVVSGPELKSRWVGESEENLRQLFHKARQSAPAIIVFDELDSFAAARGTFTGSGVEHSMVNQLLTEMDGFQSDELVFVVGTTNFVESLDPALMRPGRFEFQLHIPYPDRDDRRAILEIYNRAMDLAMTEEALEFAVRRTGDFVEGAALGTRFSGDHIQALCRSLARIRLREETDRPTEPEDIERALTEWIDRPKMTAAEEQVVATHEAGHAVVNLFCTHAKPIERISIQGDFAGALGFVRYQDRANRYVVTRGELLDDLAILMGGREAEQMLLEDISIGSAGDLDRATDIARAIVEEFGMGGEQVGLARTSSDNRESDHRRAGLSQSQLEAIDAAVRTLLEEARQIAAGILEENRAVVELLRDELVARKVIDSKTFRELTGTSEASPASPTTASPGSHAGDEGGE